MLTSVHIHQYRSCKDTRLEDLGVLTALIGRNGAGKTNVMKAIEWTARSAAGRPYPKHSDLVGSSTNGSVTVNFSIEGCDYSYSVNRYPERVNTDTAKRPELRYVFKEQLHRTGESEDVLLRRDGEQVVLGAGENEREIAISAGGAAIPSLLSLLPAEDPLAEELSVVHQYFHSVRYYPLEPSQPAITSYFISGEEYAKWASVADGSSASPEHTAYKIVTLYLDRREEFDELCSLLGEYGLNLISEIDVHPIQGSTSGTAESPSYFLTFRPIGTKFRVPFNDLSFGTQRIVQLLTAIIFSAASLALIEQPEDGIHPGLLHKLTPLLRDYAAGSQFIIASHAPGVLNRVEPEELRIVRSDEGVTIVHPLTEDQVVSAHMYLEDDGPLSDYIESL